MYRMFNSASSFNQPLDSWDVSSVTNMRSMFSFARAFNQPLDLWDVSSVTNMINMFSYATAFNQPLDSWDVSSVTDMGGMFGNAAAFNQPLDLWNVSSVTIMGGMFSSSAFNQTLSDWDVSSVTNMAYMFSGATSFNQPLSDWDVSSVTDMEEMFLRADAFNQNLGNWYIVPDSTEIARANVPGTVGGISAQNDPLDGHSPAYGIGPGGDSGFAISGNLLSMTYVAAGKGDYAVNITAAGTSVFEDGNNWRMVNVTVTGDTLPPAFSSATLDRGTGALEIAFDETIDATNIDAARFHIREPGASAGGTTLSAAELGTTADSATISFTLTAANLAAVNALAAPELTIDSSAVRDPSGNGFGPVFDVSAASFVDAFSVRSEEASPNGIAFSPDGTKMFVVGSAGDDVNEYALTAAFDVSTASFVDAFSVKSEEASPNGIAFSADGTKMFVVGFTGDDVNEYALTAAFDASTASFVDAFPVASQDVLPAGVAFSADGAKMFVVGFAGDDVSEYALAAAFDVSTASFVDAFSVRSEDTNPTGVAFSADGTKMFVTGAGGHDVNEYALAAAFDVSTASFVDAFSVSSEDTVPTGVAFSADGTKMFVVGNQNDNVYEYALSSAFDITLTGAPPDTTAPTPTISSTAGASGSTTATAAIPFSVSFSEGVTGFTSGGITVGGTGSPGAVSGFAGSGAGPYAFTVTAGSDGIVTVTVPADVAHDSGSNGNTAAGPFSITYDGTPPVPTITSSAGASGSTTGTAAIPFSISFSEAVTGFDAGDITVGGPGSVSGFSGSGPGPYAFTVTAASDGTVTVTVPADVAHDSGSNGNTAAGPFSITYDGTPPVPTITSSAGASGSTTGTAAIPFSISFSEAVTGFDAGDITVGGPGSVSGFSGSGPGPYAFTVTAASDGTVTVTVPADVAHDSGSNGNTAAGPFSVTYDGSPDTTDAFITTWRTDAPNQAVTFPGTGAYNIDWGDGDADAATGTVSHTYAGAGTYTVAATGGLTRFNLNDGASDSANDGRLQSIEQWGNMGWTTMVLAFSGAASLAYNATDAPDLSGVTDMSGMFYRASSLDGDLSSWNVSSVTDMGYMFEGASAFNGDVSGWDVSSVTDMNGMFTSATSFDQTLSGWNVSSVTDMASMFAFATSFNQPLDSWNVSSVTDMGYMFEGASAFNGNVSGWDVSSVTSMDSMFESASAFNQPLTSWDVSSVTSMDSMFESASAFNQPLTSWDVSSVTDMARMFFDASAFNQPLDWDVSSVTDMGYMFYDAAAFNQPLDWDVSSVTSMAGMFYGVSSFDQTLSGWDVSSVTNMASMFAFATSFNQPLTSWDVSSVTSMASMFYYAAAFNQPLDSWDVSSVTDMGIMFDHAFAFNGNVSGWDVSSVTDIGNMFAFARAFNQPLDSWDVSSVTDMGYMFTRATSFDQTLSGWDVSSVTNMANMFGNAAAFNQPLDSWDVSSVTNMGNMFNGASSFEQNLGKWYVTLNSTGIDRSDVPGVVGRISAQNGILTEQATYEIGTGHDSARFAIVEGSNQLNMTSVDTKGGYKVNVTSTGDFGTNNHHVLDVTVRGAADTTAPVPTITSTAGADGSATGTAQIPFSVSFDESVAGFTSSGITVGGTGSPGTVAGFAGSGAGPYAFTVTAGSDGTVTVAVPAGVAQDPNGNDNTASGTYTITYDGTGPAPTITSTAGADGSTTGTAQIPFSVSFDESVTGFTSSGITVGGTGSPGTVAGFAGSGAGPYAFTVTAGSDGTVTVAVPAGVAQDPNGNDNTASGTYTITYDSAGPAPTITSTAGADGSTTTAQIPFSVSFDESVTGFTSSGGGRNGQPGYGGRVRGKRRRPLRVHRNGGLRRDRDRRGARRRRAGPQRERQHRVRHVHHNLRRHRPGPDHHVDCGRRRLHHRRLPDSLLRVVQRGRHRVHLKRHHGGRNGQPGYGGRVRGKRRRPLRVHRNGGLRRDRDRRGARRRRAGLRLQRQHRVRHVHHNLRRYGPGILLGHA